MRPSEFEAKVDYLQQKLRGEMIPAIGITRETYEKLKDVDKETFVILESLSNDGVIVAIVEHVDEEQEDVGPDQGANEE